MKNIIICIILSLPFFAISQKMEYENIRWDENPVWKEIDSSYKKEKEVTLFEDRIIEYTFSEKYDGDFVEYFTIHVKVRVMGDDAIQANNKVYINMDGGRELVNAKARVITPDNKIVNFDESNIQKSEEEGGYKYFAIDGAVIGSDIEYTYTIIRGPSYEGRKMVFQGPYTMLDANFTLVTPVNLEFVSKSYNNLPAMVKDSTIEDKNVYRLKAGLSEPLIEENYSAYQKNLRYLIYKLDKNYSSGRSNIVSFGEISQIIYKNYFGEPEKNDMKQLKKFVKASGAMDEIDVEKKIRVFENHFKKNIAVAEGLPFFTIEQSLKYKFTSDMGALRLYVQAFKYMGIEHEIMITCDRTEDFFDSEFEHYQVLKDAFIYFPSLKMYLAPEIQTMRLGLIPPEYTNHNGLFIFEKKVGDFVTGLGKVKFVEPISHEKSADNMVINVDLKGMEDDPVVDFTREMKGYQCGYFQSMYSQFDETNKKDFDEGLIKFADETGEVISYSVTGVEEADYNVNPMVYKGQIKAPSIVEKAGNRYILNVGQLIGQQMEMYQENERQMDIEHNHNMTYHRVIRFEIPEGFDVSGLEALKIDEQYPQEKGDIYFTSDYTLNGNVVEITVNEVYKKMSFKKGEIDDFRRIINAAANFNKIAIFLTKK